MSPSATRSHFLLTGHQTGRRRDAANVTPPQTGRFNMGPERLSSTPHSRRYYAAQHYFTGSANSRSWLRKIVADPPPSRLRCVLRRCFSGRKPQRTQCRFDGRFFPATPRGSQHPRAKDAAVEAPGAAIGEKCRRWTVAAEWGDAAVGQCAGARAHPVCAHPPPQIFRPNTSGQNRDRIDGCAHPMAHTSPLLIFRICSLPCPPGFYP